MATFLKDSFVPILIILAAAAVVVLAAPPLAQTDWADGLRAGFGEGGETTEQVADAEVGEIEGAGAEGGDMGIFIYIAPLFKVTILMGIGGLLTALVWGVIKLASRGKQALQGTQ